MIPDATLVEIPSVQGHQAATSLKTDDAQFLNEEIGDFLQAVTPGERRAAACRVFGRAREFEPHGEEA
mgnify:CR=1 FL=1